MTPRPDPLYQRRTRTLGAILLGFLVAPILALIGQPSASGVDTLCLPSPTTACIAGTLRSEAEVVAGADLTVTGPNGFEETVTTSETGAWNVSVTEEGSYQVVLDEDTLPKGLKATTTEVSVDATFGVTKAAIIAIRTSSYTGKSSGFAYFVQSTANGIRLGLLLALASVGLSLIYGTTGLSNFAHAEQVTLGGILGYGLINRAGLSLWVGGVLVVLICGLTGWLQDRLMWQPLRRRGLGLAQMMIVTIGLSLALQYAFQYFAGARTVRVVTANPEVFTLGPITMTYQSVVGMGIAVIMLSIVGYALLRTRIGRATRAVSDNPALAAASGIDVDKVIRLVWTVAAALAGLSGLMYALVTNGIKWDTGMQILLLLFAAVTLGGLGTAFGALVGSLVIGLVVELAPALGMPGDFKYATAMLILILLLLVRPQGLLGRAERVG